MYTKQQRKAIYKKLLKEVCEDPHVNKGFCYYLWLLLRRRNITLLDIFYYFPELYELKPENAGLYWFPRTPKGWEKRINLLHNLIETM